LLIKAAVCACASFKFIFFPPFRVSGLTDSILLVPGLNRDVFYSPFFDIKKRNVDRPVRASLPFLSLSRFFY